jgi:hypothetical protein
MATRKKAKKKKKTPAKKAPKKLSRKKPTLKKKSAKKKKLAAAGRKKARASRKPAVKNPTVDMDALTREGLTARAAGQSGDLQGLSNRPDADSESVDELLEEGNAFEAEVVKGVEDADEEGEVHTHEVPEDDVPGEYLDQD